MFRPHYLVESYHADQSLYYLDVAAPADRDELQTVRLYCEGGHPAPVGLRDGQPPARAGLPDAQLAVRGAAGQVDAAREQGEGCGGGGRHY